MALMCFPFEVAVGAVGASIFNI